MEPSRIGLLTGHIGWIASAAWSPDGTLVASASGDGTLSVWDVDLRVRLAELRGHSLPPLSISWSPSGTTFVSGGQDGKIVFWRTKGFELEDELSFSPHWVVSLDCSPRTGHVAIAQGASLSFLKPGNHQTHRTFRHAARILTCRFSPVDGDLVAAGYEDGSLIVWSSLTGKPEHVFRGHAQAVTLPWPVSRSTAIGLSDWRSQTRADSSSALEAMEKPSKETVTDWIGPV